MSATRKYYKAIMIIRIGLRWPLLSKNIDYHIIPNRTKMSVETIQYTSICQWNRLAPSCLLFTCVSYAEARNSYRLDVRLSVCPSVCHTLAPYQNG